MRIFRLVLMAVLLAQSALWGATAPTLNATTPLTGSPEDQVSVITYADILAASGATDADGGTINFRIDSVNAGTLAIRSGTSGAGTAVVAGTTILSSGKQLLWTPPFNNNGTMHACTISAKDATNLVSATSSNVQISVAAVNDAPILTTIATLAAGTEDTAMDIAGSAILAAWDADDVDSATPTSFRINAITAGGSLGVRLTANPGDTPVTVNVGDIIDASTQTLRWTPPLNANGDVVACDIQAYDGTLASTTVGHVTVPLTAVLDHIESVVVNLNAPLSITRGVPTVFSCLDLIAATDFADPDGDVITNFVIGTTIAPAAGWKFEHLNAAHQVINSVTAAPSFASADFYLARDEFLRVTVTSALTAANPVQMGRISFISPTPEYTASPFLTFTVSEPTGGSGSSSGGGGGGCGAGAAGMGLVLALCVGMRRRKQCE